jgi:small conductance mechanosensitive channel
MILMYRIQEKAAESVDEAEALARNTIERIKGWFTDPVTLKDDVLDFVSAWGPKVLGALVVFFIGMWLARRVRNLVRGTMTRAKMDAMLANFIANLVHIALVVFIVIFAMGTLGIPTTGFAAVIAAAGFAIGFAMQGSLGNLAAGVMIMVFKPFRPGDWIEGAGHSGAVEDVGIFATTMKTGDNKRIIIPNNELTASSLVNYSTNPTRRVDMVFGISYGDDIDKARDILNSVLAADERILADPAPVVAVSELADSSVNFICRPWVNSPDYWNVRFAVTENVKKAFDKAGITIPFPQQDVYMHQVSA